MPSYVSERSTVSVIKIVHKPEGLAVKFRTCVEAACPVMDVTMASPEFTARMFDDVVKLQNPVCVLPPDIGVGLRHRATNPCPARL